jgi:hypothetical protein
LIFSQYVTNSQYIAFKIDWDPYSGIILTEKEWLETKKINLGFKAGFDELQFPNHPNQELIM